MFLSGRDHDQPKLLHDSIKGRPLVILETDDAILNRASVATVRHYGVPVNVPDQINLCSFYLASVVDRAPPSNHIWLSRRIAC
jgi:siroheme synthase (precorrin-2 oxidase/ferrochelatase)